MTRRVGPHAEAYVDLIERIGRVVRVMPTAECLQRLGIQRNELSMLRCGHESYFGWDRLHSFAIELGVPIADSWVKVQRDARQGVAA